MEKTICRFGHQRVARAAAVAGRERAAETAGGGSKPGPPDPAGDRVKKALKPGLRRRLGQANVPDRAAASGEADEDRLVDLDVQQESAAVRCGVAAALVRDGREPRALWLSAVDGVVAAGRMKSERQAHLPAVQRGAVDRAYQTATKDRSASAWNHGGGHRGEPVLEHGLYERQVGRRSFAAHSDGGGSVHTGVVCLEADRAMTGCKWRRR